MLLRSSVALNKPPVEFGASFVQRNALSWQSLTNIDIGVIISFEEICAISASDEVPDNVKGFKRQVVVGVNEVVQQQILVDPVFILQRKKS